MTNRELCERYPFLIPSNRWSGMKVTDPQAQKGGFWPGNPEAIPKPYNYEYTELDDMPDGWRKAFGEQMCEEIREELLKTGGEKALEDYRITQIKEKFGCYDDQTEVLTRNGWKLFKDVTKDDEFATLNPETDELLYHSATDIISYHYEGKMYHIENRGVNLCVTPNHSLYVAPGSYYYHAKNNMKREYPFEFATPDKYFGKDKRFKKGAIWSGVKPVQSAFKIPEYQRTNYMSINNCERTYTYEPFEADMNAWLKFLGFYIAEGHTDLRHGNGTQISIAYNPNDEEELVCDLLKGIGFEAKNAGRGLKRIHHTTLAHWLIENCGHKAMNKKVPEFVKELPPDLITIFLEYLFIGDGHKTSTSNILTTISKQLCDDVCECLIKAGYAFRYTTRDRRGKTTEWDGSKITTQHISYEINWLKNTYVEIDNSKHPTSFIEQWEDYNGMVYCVTVPNHILYVRRGGKGVWCGNSLRWYDNGFTGRGYKIIAKYAKLSERTCIRCGKPATQVSLGWISPYCDDCAAELSKTGYIDFAPIDDAEDAYLILPETEFT